MLGHIFKEEEQRLHIQLTRAQRIRHRLINGIPGVYHYHISSPRDQTPPASQAVSVDHHALHFFIDTLWVSLDHGLHLFIITRLCAPSMMGWSTRSCDDAPPTHDQTARNRHRHSIDQPKTERKKKTIIPRLRADNAAAGP